jgi:MFS family permease
MTLATDPASQMSAPTATPRPAPSVLIALTPIMAAVLIGFVVIGAALPVLPLHVRDTLGFGPFMVGIVAGCQFAAALVARLWSGHAADTKGAKWAVIFGLSAATVAGLLYLLSLRFLNMPTVSVVILLGGRAVLGGAESFIITGATTWGLVRVGAHNAGKVIAWMGTAMFAAFAAGAPLGTALYSSGGFGAVALATVIAPLATLLLIARLQGAAPVQKGSPGILSVVGRIWLPGFGAALSSVGFGAIIAFSSLLFVSHGWTPVWLPFTTYAAALILARLLFGHLPDRIGGARVALISVLVETAGLALMWLASSALMAAAGAALTGFGYSLVFPGLGVEAVRLAPSKSRGVAMGAYTACLDIALGVSGPVLGLVASVAGFRVIFLVSAIVVLSSAAVALKLQSKTVASCVPAKTNTNSTRADSRIHGRA